MNSLEARLRRDAESIEARVDQRMDASIRRRLDAVVPQAQRLTRGGRRVLLASTGAGLGLAATLLLLFRVPMHDDQAPMRIPELAAYQASVERLNRALPDAGPPEAALRRELELLGADYERVQNRLREQLDPLL